MHLNLYENSPPVVGFEMLPDFSLLQVLSLLYFFPVWWALDTSEPTSSVCFSAAVSPWCAWTCMRMALRWLPLRCCSFLFIFHYYYASSVSVFQLQQALDAFKPVQEWPSGSWLFYVTIQILSVFQLRWALDAFKPVQEWPSGSWLFVTIQVLSAFQLQWALDVSEPVWERPSGSGLWGSARLRCYASNYYVSSVFVCC